MNLILAVFERKPAGFDKNLHKQNFINYIRDLNSVTGNHNFTTSSYLADRHPVDDGEKGMGMKIFLLSIVISEKSSRFDHEKTLSFNSAVFLHDHSPLVKF